MKKYTLAALLACILLLFSFSTTNRLFEISKGLETFASLYKEVIEYYVDDVNPTELLEEGVTAMLNELDPYTVYIPENRIEDYRAANTGQYAGIGVTVQDYDGSIHIEKVKKDYPGDRAGLLPGDEIIAIDEVDLDGLTYEQFNTLIKGQVNSEMKIKVKRHINNQTLSFTLKREKVNNKSVSYAGMVTENTGYVKLDEFSMHCGRDLKKEVKTLLEKGAESLIIDLRGNPGGLLIESVNIVNLFIEKGKEVVTTKGKVQSSNNTYYTLSSPLNTEVPLAILINSSSASASEIVSGTLQDYDRAVIIGNRSFGKGLVQVTKPLSFNSQLKVTTAKYYTPSGRCIQALDYSNRNPDGSVGKVADSLKSSFQTENGRLVYDGGGVDPDLKVNEKTLPRAAQALIKNGYIIDYASKYFLENKNKAMDIESFQLDGVTYNNFTAWVKDKPYSYTTVVEEKIDKLIRNAKNEKFYEKLNNETNGILEAINERKKQDLEAFKNDISGILAEEIVSRYYYESGSIQYGLSKDPYVNEALKVLSDTEKYNSILGR